MNLVFFFFFNLLLKIKLNKINLYTDHSIQKESMLFVEHKVDGSVAFGFDFGHVVA
jgi:hypothetical protein